MFISSGFTGVAFFRVSVPDWQSFSMCAVNGCVSLVFKMPSLSLLLIVRRFCCSSS